MFPIKLILSSILLLLSYGATALDSLTEQDRTTIEQDVARMNHNLKYGTVADFISVMPPELVVGFGGAESFAKKTKADFEKLRADNINISAYELGDLYSIYKLDEKVIVTFPYQSTIDYDDETFLMKSYLIAIKYLESNSWYYIDGKGYNQSKNLMHVFLPYLPENIKVPNIETIRVEE